MLVSKASLFFWEQKILLDQSALPAGCTPCEDFCCFCKEKLVEVLKQERYRMAYFSEKESF